MELSDYATLDYASLAHKLRMLTQSDITTDQLLDFRDSPHGLGANVVLVPNLLSGRSGLYFTDEGSLELLAEFKSEISGRTVTSKSSSKYGIKDPVADALAKLMFHVENPPTAIGIEVHRKSIVH